MVSIVALWLPIVVAAVLVFVLSSILHTVLNYHAADYRGLPKEDELRATLRGAGLTPGLYTVPTCKSAKDMGSPETVAKYNEGPVLMMTVLPTGPPAMGKLLVQWFVYCLVVGLFIAYIAGVVLPVGAHYLTVFRVVGTIAFLTYGLGNTVHSIWKGQPWSATLKEVIDGLLYALVTAGAFGWLWPR